VAFPRDAWDGFCALADVPREAWHSPRAVPIPPEYRQEWTRRECPRGCALLAGPCATSTTCKAGYRA
jgi:hypothetical protein